VAVIRSGAAQRRGSSRSVQHLSERQGMAGYWQDGSQVLLADVPSADTIWVPNVGYCMDPYACQYQMPPLHEEGCEYGYFDEDGYPQMESGEWQVASEPAATVRPAKAKPQNTAKAIKGLKRREKQRERRRLSRNMDCASVGTAESLDSLSHASSSPAMSRSDSTPSTAHSRTPHLNNQFQQMDESVLAPSILSMLMARATWVCLIRRVEVMLTVRDLAWRAPLKGSLALTHPLCAAAEADASYECDATPSMEAMEEAMEDLAIVDGRGVEKPSPKPD